MVVQQISLIMSIRDKLYGVRPFLGIFLLYIFVTSTLIYPI